ncbi:Methylosome protein 50 [Holothuria leucospilota]|uniref:Methylosome protein 50 n=1 Tax=Holothuria leucospilota TaxID=206669 RepID=A0A9Q1H475_HOLLE|nr:Methylosome protein 50 [Holothuria leucospilota]
MTADNNVIPPSMETYLESIQHNRDGSVILGASGLTGKTWAGSLWFYEDPENAPDVDKCSAGVQTKAGITEVQWIDESRIAVGSDTGAIEVWQLINSRSAFRNLFYLYEHNNIVHSISINSNRTRVVSGSADCLVKIWDLGQQVSISTFRGHTAKVDCVACSPNELDVFLSCSQDGSILLWDTRMSFPARRLVRVTGASLPTCVTWKPGETHVFASGDQIGNVMVQDTRAGVASASLSKAHNRSVHRVAFSSKNPLWLASVSEDCTACVTELQPQLKQIYRSYSHNDFVQGVSWDTLSNKLLTCGWDRQVITHDVKLATDTS